MQINKKSKGEAEESDSDDDSEAEDSDSKSKGKKIPKRANPNRYGEKRHAPSIAQGLLILIGCHAGLAY